MGTSTAKAQLYKPAEVGEIIDVKTSLNDNWDKVDALIGARSVTSSTRPASPYDGMIIKEIDTKAIGVWDAASSQWMMYDSIMQAYTPTVYGAATAFSVGNIGNGSVSGRYYRMGKLCRVTGNFSMGSTSAYPAAGAFSFGLPFPGVSQAAYGWGGNLDGGNGRFRAGQAGQTMAGMTTYTPTFVDRVASVIEVTASTSGGGNVTNANFQIGSTLGLTANGHFINLDVLYVIA